MLRVNFFNKPNLLYWLPAIAFLIVAITARIVSWRVDLFGGYFDDYNLMGNIEKDLFTYVHTYYGGVVLPQLIIYWFSNRLLNDNSVQTYLLVPLLVNIAALVTMYLGIKKYWRSPLLTALVIGFLCFNAHTLWLTEYTLSSYAFSFLTTLIYFFFLLGIVLDQPYFPIKPAYQWLLWIVLAFFSNLIMLIPVYAGVVSIIILHLFTHKTLKIYQFKKYIQLIPGAIIFPAVYFITYKIHPFNNLGFAARPDMHGYFLYSSAFTKDVSGALQFIIQNTKVLFFQLVYFVINLFGWGAKIFVAYKLLILGLLLLIMLAVIAANFISLKLIKRNRGILFSALFFLTMFIIMAFGGIAGKYPFGTIRYGTHLLVPFAFLVMYPLYIFIKQSLIWLKTRSYKQIPPPYIVILSLFIFMFGEYLNLVRYRANEDLRQKNEQAYANILRLNPEAVLFNNGVKPVLRQKVPVLFAQGQSMGWGSFFGQGSDGGIPAFVHTYLTSRASVLIITEDKQVFDTFPSYTSLLNKGFALQQTIEGPNVYSQYYIKSD